jgi:hypothetical protein
VGLAYLACATPSIKPEPFELSGSWELLNAVSELPVAPEYTGSGGAYDYASAHSSPNTHTLNAVLRYVTEPPRTLEIVRTDSAVMLSMGSDQSLLLYTDGRPSKVLIADFANCSCQVAWDGNTLAVRHSVDGHTHIVETYARSRGGTRLLVTVTIEDRRLARRLTSQRLYDRMSS